MNETFFLVAIDINSITYESKGLGPELKSDVDRMGFFLGLNGAVDLGPVKERLTHKEKLLNKKIKHYSTDLYNEINKNESLAKLLDEESDKIKIIKKKLKFLEKEKDLFLRCSTYEVTVDAELIQIVSIEKVKS